MKMIITNITCDSTISGALKDDVFLLIQSDAGPPIRWPSFGFHAMGPGDQLPLPSGGYSVDFDYGVAVTAFDWDSKLVNVFDDPDYLFNISANTSTPSGTTSTYTHNPVSGNTARYSYTLEITQ